MPQEDVIVYRSKAPVHYHFPEKHVRCRSSLPSSRNHHSTPIWLDYVRFENPRTKPALLFHPPSLNSCIKEYLHPRGWTQPASGSRRINLGKGAFREMDGIKNKVGLEIQFGKYAFMGYDIFAKMVIFAKRKLIHCGIEVVAMPELVRDMSTGVSSFNQIVMDMGERGEADLDIPTLVIGIGLTPREKTLCAAKRERFRTSRDEMLAAGEVSRGRAGARPGPKGPSAIFDEEGADSEE
ncbi:MAG: hypothetical protein HYS13_06640 [Planctomycetia bacterium]|nr:hypothetical protein [Planctomycetia bacterium]